MFRFKQVSSIIVVFSVAFVIIYLLKTDYLVTFRIQNISILVLSYFFIFMGFIFDVLSIRLFLKFNNIDISFSESVILSGKYSLAKYIPGKIGVIIGKAAYICDKCKIGKFRSLEIVFVYQLLFLLSAIVLSAATLFNFLIAQSEKLVYIMLSLVFIVCLLSIKQVQQIIRFVLMKITKREFREIYSNKSILIALIGTLFCWLLWAFGFKILAASIGVDISNHAALIFPLAAIIGVLVIISPGGLGVREGVISAGLIFFGIEKLDAIGLSVYSRLWFLVGEVLFFLFVMGISIAGKHSAQKK